MIFKIKQTVAHKDYPTGFIKESHVIGMDLPHALTQTRFQDHIKEQLKKNYRATHTDENGRVLIVEIVEQVESKT
jgi:hypothetical protein